MTATLYDTGVSPAVPIATVMLSIERRAEPVIAHFKGDGGWEHLADGAKSLSKRLVCEGHIDASWLGVLETRYEAGELSSYAVVKDDGSEHSGIFFIAQLDELTSFERSIFRLVLRSSGATVYTPAP